MINYNHCPSRHFSATNDSTIDNFLLVDQGCTFPMPLKKPEELLHSIAVLRQFELLSFRYAKILGKTKM